LKSQRIDDVVISDI